MKNWKPWGGHHLLPAALILAALYFCPAEYRIAAGNALFWFGKELGEATQRAGGTGKALHDWTQVKNGGPWEPWDWITPGIAGTPIGILA